MGREILFDELFKAAEITVQYTIASPEFNFDENGVFDFGENKLFNEVQDGTMKIDGKVFKILICHVNGKLFLKKIDELK